MVLWHPRHCAGLTIRIKGLISGSVYCGAVVVFVWHPRHCSGRTIRDMRLGTLVPCIERQRWSRSILVTVQTGPSEHKAGFPV
jgi:hypothetical protein